jgi:hypothetical protein
VHASINENRAIKNYEQYVLYDFIYINNKTVITKRAAAAAAAASARESSVVIVRAKREI